MFFFVPFGTSGHDCHGFQPVSIYIISIGVNILENVVEKVESKSEKKMFKKVSIGAIATVALCCMASAVFADGTNLMGEATDPSMLTADAKATAPTAVKWGLTGMAVMFGIRMVPKAIKSFTR